MPETRRFAGPGSLANTRALHFNTLVARYTPLSTPTLAGSSADYALRALHKAGDRRQHVSARKAPHAATSRHGGASPTLADHPHNARSKRTDAATGPLPCGALRAHCATPAVLRSAGSILEDHLEMTSPPSTASNIAMLNMSNCLKEEPMAEREDVERCHAAARNRARPCDFAMHPVPPSACTQHSRNRAPRGQGGTIDSRSSKGLYTVHTAGAARAPSTLTRKAICQPRQILIQRGQPMCLRKRRDYGDPKLAALLGEQSRGRPGGSSLRLVPP